MAVTRRFHESASTPTSGSRQIRTTGTKSFPKGAKGIEPTKWLLYIGLLTVSALLTLILIIAAQLLISIESVGLRKQHQRQSHSFYKPRISSEAEFSKICSMYVQTYSFQDGKVKWDGIYSYMTRGASMHCMLARAAKRLGPDFRTTIRIGLADMDVGGQLTFQPASMDHNMTANQDEPLLFPDNTFESWPEVYDYSLTQSMRKVMDTARSFGLPGTEPWEHRNATVVWRGGVYGKERKELVESASLLLDIQPTSFNLTAQGFQLSSSNQLSRSQLCGYRFLLHVNGIFNDRYSSSVKWKLLCGSLVFVPTEPLFVEWWNYNVWKPHVHYVPYTSIPDLLEQIEYYSKNLKEAAIIAKNGMDLAQDAFGALEGWVDETLVRYAAATHGKDANCTYKFDSRPPSEFKSLEDLQEQYGPTVCAS